MVRTTLYAMAAVPFLMAPAAAQDHTSASHACQFNGLGFSLGSTILIGKTVHRCEWADSQQLPRWYRVNHEATLPDGTPNKVENTEASANCLYANAFYGNGSLIVVRDQVLTCSQGAWFPTKE